MNLDETPVEEQQGPTREQELEAEVNRLKAESDELRNQMLRTIAEAQNIQRRLREQSEESVKFAVQPLVESLLPVLDNLERAVSSLESGASVESVMEGVRVIDRQLRQALSSAKVERIESAGAPFDPEFHEALTTLVTTEVPEGTVTSEIEPGYKLHGRVVRPARVQVSKLP